MTAEESATDGHVQIQDNKNSEEGQYPDSIRLRMLKSSRVVSRRTVCVVCAKLCKSAVVIRRG